MTRRIIGLGAEGLAAAITELIEWNGMCEATSLLNDDDSIKFDQFQKPPVIGRTEDLPRVAEREGLRDFFVGLGSVRSREKKRELYEYGIKCGLKPYGVSHPRAIISRSAQLGRGQCVLAGAIIGPYSVLRENVTVNMGAMIESRCFIQSHAQLAAGCWVGSGVQIGQCSYIGNGAFVQPNIRIGENVVVAPGAVVAEDVPDGEVISSLPKDQADQMGRKLRPARAAAEKAGAKMAVA